MQSDQPMIDIESRFLKSSGAVLSNECAYQKTCSQIRNPSIWSWQQNMQIHCSGKRTSDLMAPGRKTVMGTAEPSSTRSVSKNWLTAALEAWQRKGKREQVSRDLGEEITALFHRSVVNSVCSPVVIELRTQKFVVTYGVRPQKPDTSTERC